MMTDILQGNANALGQGSWVFNQQGVAADKGFRNVSQYWYPKTKSFDEGMEELASKIQNREDLTFGLKDLEFTTVGDQFAVDIDGRKFIPNEYGGKQLMSKLGCGQTLWSEYAAGDDGDLDVLIHACENGQRKMKEKDLFIRVYANDDSKADGTIRTVMSDKYAPIDNQWYLEVLKEFVPGGRLSHFSFCDGDTIYGNVLIPDTIREEKDSDYGGMLSISNCEIGKRRIGQTPSIFRAICMNGCIWGQIRGESAMSKVHRGKIDLNDLKRRLAENIQQQIPLSVEAIKTLLDTKVWKTDALMKNMLAIIMQDYSGVSREVMADSWDEWNNNTKEHTAFGLIDGITRAGQKRKAEEWNLMDTIAGNIVRKGKIEFDMMTARAKSLSDAQVNKLLTAV